MEGTHVEMYGRDDDFFDTLLRKQFWKTDLSSRGACRMLEMKPASRTLYRPRWRWISVEPNQRNALCGGGEKISAQNEGYHNLCHQ
jgi:hypothetical protein